MNDESRTTGMEELLEKTRSDLPQAKRRELETLAASNEGQRVREMLGGDAAGLRQTLKGALGTPEGEALLKKLSELFT